MQQHVHRNYNMDNMSTTSVFKMTLIMFILKEFQTENDS